MTATAEISREDAEETKPQLPNGWRRAKLGDVARVFAGSGAPQGKEFFDPNGSPFVRVSDLGTVKRTTNLTQVQDRLSAKALKECSLVLAKEGTVVFPKSGAAITTNNRAILGMDAYIVGHLLAVEPTDAAISLWLYWALCQVDMMDYSDNTGYPSLKQSVVEKIEIPLPPLAEQKRIAGVLKEQMAAMERARASAEAQLQAAENLPAAYLRAVFDNGESKSWPRKKLGDIFKVKSGESMTAKAMTQGGQYPVYGGNGINGYHDAYLLDERRVVIGRVGANCGCIHLSQPKSWITDNALYVSQKLVEFDDNFIADALRFVDLNSKSNSMAQPLVTGQLIYPLEIGFPPLADQRRIAAQLSSQMTSAERLRQTLAEQLAAINSLPAALLRRAFSGEL